MKDIAGQKLMIIGAALSGQAAARLALGLKARVRISEHKKEDDVPLEFRQWARANGVLMEFQGHSQPFIEDSDMVLVSPGVKLDAPPLRWARAKGIPVIGEIELASRVCRCPILAVTGSNGKTTVSTLIHKILQEAGKRVRLCGNIGSPFSDHVLESENLDYVVVEISSFQLETTQYFKPHVAVLLNFSCNHLDWHKDIEEYFAAKKRIFINQGPGDFAVLNARDDRLRGLAGELKAKVCFFNDQPPREGVKENPNFLAAEKATSILGVAPDVSRKVFEHFPGVEHRMERVKVIDGIEFINDSKATTAEAGRWAMERIAHPIIMICGGRDKNIDFSGLRDLASRKLKKMIIIGEAREKLKEIFASCVNVEEADSLQQAVERARQSAASGDCVLLSPMCASYDMFRNFEERGRVFKEIVRNLK